MVQPAPRITSAPVEKSNEVVRTVIGAAIVYFAAISVENRQGNKR